MPLSICLLEPNFIGLFIAICPVVFCVIPLTNRSPPTNAQGGKSNFLAEVKKKKSCLAIEPYSLATDFINHFANTKSISWTGI